MDAVYDDFDRDAIKNIKVERERKPFKLSKLKIEHFYFNSGDYSVGTSISTSLEISSKYDFVTQKNIGLINVAHNYYGLDGKVKIRKREGRVEDYEGLLINLEKNDIRDLKNNLFTEDAPERFTFWELSYNYHFRITGTYDQMPNEVAGMIETLKFKDICDGECQNIKNEISKSMRDEE